MSVTAPTGDWTVDSELSVKRSRLSALTADATLLLTSDAALSWLLDGARVGVSLGAPSGGLRDGDRDDDGLLLFQRGCSRRSSQAIRGHGFSAETGGSTIRAARRATPGPTRVQARTSPTC